MLCIWKIFNIKWIYDSFCVCMCQCVCMRDNRKWNVYKCVCRFLQNSLTHTRIHDVNLFEWLYFHYETTNRIKYTPVTTVTVSVIAWWLSDDGFINAYMYSENFYTQIHMWCSLYMWFTLTLTYALWFAICHRHQRIIPGMLSSLFHLFASASHQKKNVFCWNRKKSRPCVWFFSSFSFFLWITWFLWCLFIACCYGYACISRCVHVT